jgi:hypothetical protein
LENTYDTALFFLGIRDELIITVLLRKGLKMKIDKKTVSAALMLISLLAHFHPTYYWVCNPDTTEMRMLVTFWKYYLVGILTALGSVALIVEKKHD